MSDPIDIVERLRAAGKNWVHLMPFHRALCDESASEITRLRAALAAQGAQWQPIESAPDGVSVLACNGLGYVGRAVKCQGHWQHIGKPTHWMPIPAAPGAPTVEAAHDMGAKGGPSVEAERLAFEAWMRGHCWALCAKWTGAQYLSDGEQDGWPDPQAMATRRLWAAWRDRAALAVPAGMVLVPVEPTRAMLEAFFGHHRFDDSWLKAYRDMLAASQESATTRGRG